MNSSLGPADIDPAELAAFQDLLDRSSLAHITPKPTDSSPRITPDAPEQYYIGIEVLTDRLVVGVLLACSTGECLSRRVSRLTDMTPDSVVAGICAVVEELRQDPELGQGHVSGIGVELGGPVDVRTGTVLFYRKAQMARAGGPPEFTWPSNTPLGGMIADRVHLPVAVANDGDAFAAFHRRFGLGRELSRFAVILVREGIGGSLVLNGQILDTPMEIGNLVVHPDGMPCDCGNHGCLEVTAGVYGIVATARAWATEKPHTLREAVDMTEHSKESDKLEHAFAGAGTAAARGVGHLATLFNPHYVIICAPQLLLDQTSRAGQAYVRALETFPEYVSHDSFRQTQLRYATIEPFDGATGAALIALERLGRATPRGGAW